MVICVVIYYWVLFFFKQKTAYEMRISDWSSDVCSSDLRRCDGSRIRLAGQYSVENGATCHQCGQRPHRIKASRKRQSAFVWNTLGGGLKAGQAAESRRNTHRAPCIGTDSGNTHSVGHGNACARRRATGNAACRSEAHTSELQSLMRTSYAAFC